MRPVARHRFLARRFRLFVKPMPFSTANPSVARALAERQYLTATPVQAAVLAAGAADKDLLVSAQTGSGKTVAFGMALADTLLGTDERFAQAGAPLALIIAPTRELALQVHSELTWLFDKTAARVVSCVGGMDARREARALNAGVHIVVGTPGRLRDHLERGALDISALRVVVLDEADEMLDMGFREDLEFMLDAMPESRRTLLFSATLPKEIVQLAKRYQREALRIDTIVQNQPHADIEYQAVRCAPNDIEHAIVNLLRFRDNGAAIIFCGTREKVKHLHSSLVERGFSAVALSGEFSQSERTHALQSLRDGRSRVCVATDVAARGLDLPDLQLVIHADLPTNRDTLLHRSGRTGRAGRKGMCALIIPHTRRRQAERLFSNARINIDWTTPPTADQIRARDLEKLIDHPSFAAELTEEDKSLADALLAKRSPAELAQALARQLRADLPAAEDFLDPVQPERERRERQAYDPAAMDFGEPIPMVAFRMNAGRFNNAEPRWLIPLICRLGHITKREIGNIRIGERETKVEIAAHVAQRFMAALRQSADPEVRMEPMDASAPAPERRERRERAPDRTEERGQERSQERAPHGKPPFKPHKKKFAPKAHPGAPRAAAAPGDTGAKKKKKKDKKAARG